MSENRFDPFLASGKLLRKQVIAISTVSLLETKSLVESLVRHTEYNVSPILIFAIAFMSLTASYYLFELRRRRRNFNLPN